MQSEISGRHHDLLEAEDLLLHPAAGRVWPSRDFARRHLDLLAPAEAEVVDACAAALGDEDGGFERPLVRTARLAAGGPAVPAKRGGARSAYLPERQVKVKACRPEPASFPQWELDDGFALSVREIPFGVLTAEGAMREILAWCFERRQEMPSAGRPLAVFEYGEHGEAGYALASLVPGDERVERFIDDGGATVHDLVRLARRGRLAPRQIGLAGLDEEAYVEAKADLLARLNFGGGFRGVLNSNVGNDVVRDGRLAALCDYDTFHLLPVPEAGDRDGARRFTMRAAIELLKSSLPIVDWVDQPDDGPGGPLHRALAERYRAASRVFAAYRRRFDEGAAARGWDRAMVAAAFDEALLLPIAFELLQELVPNPTTARAIKVDSHYVPHN